MNDDTTTDLAALPGLALFTSEFRTLLEAAASGDMSSREALLEHTKDAVDVLAELELLQFVYIAQDDDLDGEPDEDEDMAWFSVDGVEIDPDRDAVMLIGDVTHLYGGPITLEGVDDDHEHIEGHAEEEV